VDIFTYSELPQGDALFCAPSATPAAKATSKSKKGQGKQLTQKQQI
jgi:hypothetical protein